MRTYLWGRLRPAVATLIGVGLVSVSAISCGQTDGTPAPVRSTATSGAASTAASTSRVTGTSASAAGNPDYAELHASWEKSDFGPGVGLALVPVGGGEVLTFGNQNQRVAWSTIKVPLALAAQRNGSKQALISKAIINSDNDAALSLRESLGTPEEARTKVTAVLRDGGDDSTAVVTIKAADETFGLTEWKLADAATFAAHLPCMKDTDEILTYMGEVNSNQQWGIESMTSPRVTTALKGGWGPADQGGYEVRQLGLITWKDGRELAVTMQTYQPGQEMSTGIAHLNEVAAWLDKNVAKLPRGKC
ncbi:MAG: hypothetical protein WAW85_16020 [Gordonia sp. (in: high G+C Gram-positive bacteria)]|uniref:hypothetical protein n=1 Tax=Gordonia sp. (in: high G+C Gram-positive bacteria) TaxID=84139 RepID=UPI003BB7FEB9